MQRSVDFSKILALACLSGLLGCQGALFEDYSKTAAKPQHRSDFQGARGLDDEFDPQGLTYEDELLRELDMIRSTVRDETFVIEGYEFTDLQSSHEDFISEVTGERPHLLGMTVGEVVEMVTFGSSPLHHKVSFIDVVQAADRFMTGGSAKEMGYELQTANSNKPKCNGDSSISNKGCPNKELDPEGPEAIARKCEDSLTTLDNTEAWLASNVWNRQPRAKPRASLFEEGDEAAESESENDSSDETLGGVEGVLDVPLYKKTEPVVYMRRNQAINYRAKHCL